MEKTVKIKWEGKEVDVVLQQLTWGDHKQIREDSVVLKEYKGKPMQFRNVDLMDDLKIVKSIKESPFDATMENVDKLTEAERYKLAVAVQLLDGEEDATESKPAE